MVPGKKKHPLLSRKFLAAVFTALMVILNDGLDLGLDEQSLEYIFWLVLGWIGVEGAVDTARSLRNPFS